MKIKVGDKISELSLPNIDGTEFDLVKIPVSYTHLTLPTKA